MPFRAAVNRRKSLCDHGWRSGRVGGVSGHQNQQEPGGQDVVVQIEVEGATLDLTVRSLRTQDDYDQFEELESTTWGERYVVPSSLVMVTQKIGGVSAGAFDAQGRMVGLVYGLTGWRAGRRVHWSHMLAVRDPLRGCGLGRELKFFQRRLVREQRVASMLWTYDPLVARNAHLNINRLGARPVEYLEDVYGPGSDSILHRGLGTDRFVVEWLLESQSWAGEDGSDWMSAPIVNTDASGQPLGGDFEPSAASQVRIEVPVDIQTAKTESEDAGSRWRQCTRRAFRECLGRGLEVVGFDRGRTDGRCFYLLRGGEDR